MNIKNDLFNNYTILMFTAYILTAMYERQHINYVTVNFIIIFIVILRYLTRCESFMLLETCSNDTNF